MELSSKGSSYNAVESVRGIAPSNKDQILSFLLQENKLTSKKIEYATRIQSKLEHNPNSNDHLMIIVRLANIVCNKLGFGINLNPSIVLVATPEAELLNLSEIKIAELEVRLEDSKLLN